jgi:nucleotide-binding universal stress UspA family protein
MEAKMFEKILYPTDFSEISKKSMDFIKQLKGAGTKEVVVFHVIDRRMIDRIGHHSEVGIDAEVIEKKMKAQAQEEIRTVEDELKGSGFKVKTRIDKGVPFSEILKAEQEEGISVVVIGSHGASCIEEMLLGSVSEKVIRKSNKPVLIVRR